MESRDPSAICFQADTGPCMPGNRTEDSLRYPVAARILMKLVHEIGRHWYAGKHIARRTFTLEGLDMCSSQAQAESSRKIC
jgi:hypothetical protein